MTMGPTKVQRLQNAAYCLLALWKTAPHLLALQRLQMSKTEILHWLLLSLQLLAG